MTSARGRNDVLDCYSGARSQDDQGQKTAAHAQTSPVLVRGVLGSLRQTGLLVPERDHARGWKLVRTPQTVTLADIHLALNERMAPKRDPDAPHCAVQDALEQLMAQIMDEAEATLASRLKAVPIGNARSKPPFASKQRGRPSEGQDARITLPRNAGRGPLPNATEQDGDRR